MEIHAEAFWVQKAGSSVSEYEDAFYPSGLADAPQSCSRVAIADGATDSSFSGIWARLLVKAFVERGVGTDDIDAILSEVQPEWGEEVGRRKLPWYAQEKAQLGAFSSLLGFTIRHEPEIGGRGRWQAVAVGDSCLVQVRNERVTVRFPLDHSSSFNSAPFLVPSNPRLNASVRDNVAEVHGEVRLDDSFYLMTDALACWFMSEAEQNRRPWQALRDLNTQEQLESFSEMVDRLRGTHELKNDDCTLLRIDIC